MKILFKVLLLAALAFVTNAMAAPSVSVSFILDESGSVSQSNFEIEKQGFINALNDMPIDGSIEVSAIGFSRSHEVIAGLTTLTSSTAQTVESLLANNSQSGRTTAMSGAITAATNLLASSAAASKIICIATDGVPDNQGYTLDAANNAKAQGINISPIGIGLSSSGRTFLDSIASHPPIPNPENFSEFSAVVSSDCVGVVKSALNVQMNPETVDFGAFSNSDLSNDIDVCGNVEHIGVYNNSNQAAEIINIGITGAYGDAYQLVSFMGDAPIDLQFPVEFSPGAIAEVKIKLNSAGISAPVPDPVFDATFSVTVRDGSGIENTFHSSLISKVGNSSCLGLNVIDASPTINKISDAGISLKEDGTEVGEIDVSLAIQNDSQKLLVREGLIADGNSRLLFVADTRKSTGKVRFEIENPALTEARFYTLDHNPTYKTGTRVYDDTGKASIDLDIGITPNGNGQTTAVLRAGERFLGGKSDSKLDIDIKVCILDDADECSTQVYSKTLSEYKPSAVLIHGLWANPDSFQKHVVYSSADSEEGLYEFLRDNGYYFTQVADYCQGGASQCKENNTYPDYIGPSEHMTSNATWLDNYVSKACSSWRNNAKVACTRVDLIGHSMGGLMSRAFINQNSYYKKSENFHLGSVRRLITLSTPHVGSGIANLLTTNDSEIGSCIRTEEKAFTYPTGLRKKSIGIGFEFSYGLKLMTGEEVIKDLIIGQILEKTYSVGGKVIKGAINRVDSAIDDLQLGDIENDFLNSPNSIMNKDLEVPTFLVYGDINDSLGMDISQYEIISKVLPDDICDANDSPNECTSNITEYLTGCSTSEIFRNDDSDGIVPLYSSKWDSYISDDQYKESVTHQHTGMGKNSNIMNIVLDKLNAPLTDFYLK